jgi:putative hydrolase of the HAD superfamily
MKIIHKDKFLELPDAILFDTDNTLYEYEPAHKAGMLAVENKVTKSFSITESDFKNAFKQARNEVKKRLEGTASSHSRLLYMQRMLELMGLGSQTLWTLDLEQTYWRTFLSNAHLFSGVKELLLEIKRLGIPTAIITDLTAQIQFRKIVYFGLDNDFDYIVTSEESLYDKPHPAPFEICIEKISPKGNNIWMIGDNPINDIRGSKSAIGATTLQKIHAGVIPGDADLFFETFESLTTLINQIPTHA